MANFHLKNVYPIMQHFVTWTENHLYEQLGVANGIEPKNFKKEALSRTETLRSAQAIYRYQFLCQLVGPRLESRRHNLEHTVEALFAVLDAWKIEQLFSFYQYVEEQYWSVLDRIRWDIHPNNPKFDDQGRPPTPDGAFDLESDSSRWVFGANDHLAVSGRCFVEGLALSGLPLLCTILFDVPEKPDLVKTIQTHMMRSYVPLDTDYGPSGRQRRYRESSRTPQRATKRTSLSSRVPSVETTRWAHHRFLGRSSGIGRGVTCTGMTSRTTCGNGMGVLRQTRQGVELAIGKYWDQNGGVEYADNRRYLREAYADRWGPLEDLDVTSV
ncbi:hypothetical protein BU23DRAFT_629578 [Bimuria novae-zelandiae CBS 107.79]|uniref:Uncharacterized protein n=1 Tax=Bimuria novae-zelandiae CBS 107.79 TaxID=1447943 RepID=A0A6A5UJG8_9PLEO|nr:hypothetical protein BU23DRAFT_629578 [Bimuria novae-zelandiae CBS 107.79]